MADARDMLLVDVKLIAYELVPGLTGGEYSVADGATVRDLLAVCEAQCGAAIPAKNFRNMYPLFNGRPLSLDSVLSQNGTLHLCRVVMSG